MEAVERLWENEDDVSCSCEMGEGGTVPAAGMVNANVNVNVGDRGQCCVVASDVGSAPYSQIEL